MRPSITTGALLLAGAFLLAFLAAPPHGFATAGEGASWWLMDSLASHTWAGAALETPAAAIDPQGAFAPPFARARAGRWYSKAPPLLPLVASILYAALGALGAYLVPAAGAVGCYVFSFRLARRIGRRHSDRPAEVASAIAAVAATPVLVHGALFCGHALGAALVAAGALRLMTAFERGFFSGRGAPRAVAGAALCLGLAALADPSTVWFGPGAVGAWAILREGRWRLGPDQGPRWRVAFLALAAALHVAAGLIAQRFQSMGEEVWGREWGATILLAVAPLSVVTLYGLTRLLPEAFPRSAGAARWIWILGITAGLIVQGVGLRSLLKERIAGANLADAAAAAAPPGMTILTDETAVAGILGSLASTRAIFVASAEAGLDPFLTAADAVGAHTMAVVSAPPRGAETADPLAGRRALGRFLREGEPRHEGTYLISRFLSAGPASSRPSEPPRGD